MQTCESFSTSSRSHRRTKVCNTLFHVAYVDFESIRKEKSLTGFDTNCRTGEVTRGGGGGEWEPLKILVLQVCDFNPKDQPERPSRDSEQHIRAQHKQCHLYTPKTLRTLSKTSWKLSESKSLESQRGSVGLRSGSAGGPTVSIV
jgi:hypothetical protein